MRNAPAASAAAKPACSRAASRGDFPAGTICSALALGILFLAWRIASVW